MSPFLISIAAFVGVAALVGGIVLFVRGRSENTIENRLDVFTGHATPGAAKESLLEDSVLARPLDDVPNVIEAVMARFGAASQFFEQADSNLTAGKFAAISGMLFCVGAAGGTLTGFGPIAALVVGGMVGVGPLFWLMWKRKRRLKKFAVQLPDALELISRALRAGHSLASGFNLVREEMPAPVGIEFGRVFEEQNLGIPMEEALDQMTVRVPNLDLRFFATAVILQRQTGGDLAEILDKIGHLIRERFKIWGQVQALTGEGRLSGIVLLALPPALFLAVYRLNPDYVMLLFNDPMGKQMLAGAVVLQILGALVIRKIINIKV
jgi:tight adherence protein B